MTPEGPSEDFGTPPGWAKARGRACPTAKTRFPRIANVDRVHGDHDSADFDFPKEIVCESFGERRFPLLAFAIR